MNSTKKWLTNLLDAPLVGIEDLVKLSDDRLDPITRNGFDTAKVGVIRGRKTRANHIFARLGHLSVNPSDPLNRNAIVGSYFIHPGKYSASPAKNHVNLDEASAEKFIKKLIWQAAVERDLFVNPDPAQHEESKDFTRLFLLHGPRGVGKTAFINYLLTKWTEELDRERVIWVRIDLTKTFLPDDNLLEWIYAQVAKIAMRYYDSLSSRFDRRGQFDLSQTDFIEKVETWLRSQSEDIRFQLTNCWIRMRDGFRGKTAEVVLNSQTMPSSITTLIFRLLLEYGAKIVVVLDGVDVLESTPTSLKRFQHIDNQISQFATETSALGFPILFVSRTGTLRYLKQTTYRTVPMAQAFSIGVVPLAQIASRRFDFIKSEVERLGPDYGWDLSDWPQHIENFQSFLSKAEEGGRYELFLERTFQDNRRAQLQLLQLAYFDFVSEERSGRFREKRTQQYRLVETMMKIGYSYPPVHYSYIAKDGKIEPKFDQGIGGDRIFMPSLFRYPFVTAPRDDDFDYAGTELLAGLRIMQMVDAIGSLNYEKEQVLDVNELTYLCSILFRYDSKLIKRLIQEFEEYEIVSFYGEGFGFVKLEQSRVVGMTKLNRILTVLLADVAYLGLSLMRAPIPNPSFGLAEDPGGIVRVARLDSEGGDLLEWITAKTINAITAFRIISHLNARQAREFATNSRDVKDTKSRRHSVLINMLREYDMFDFTNTLKGKLIDNLMHTLSYPVIRRQGPSEVVPLNDARVEQSFALYQKCWSA